jgi:hypothetical protein
MIEGVFPILFISQQHKSMVAHGKITSAAFWKVMNGKVETYGRSTSLEMGPQPDDARILEHFLGLS